MASTHSSQYEYDDLADPETCFRLLTLIPGYPTEPICCKLTQHNLFNVDTYEALSYTWGQPCDMILIKVDGQDFLVRPNLYQCLQKLRPEAGQSIKLLYVDAICINQGKLSERNAQVKIMGEIYRSASLVNIWLGPAEHDSDKIFHISNAATITANEQKPNDPDFAYLTMYEAIVKELIQRDEVGIAPLQSLFQRQYWSRLWIIQEFLLAKQVVFHCGAAITSADTLRNILGIYGAIGDVELNTAAVLRRTYRQAGLPDFWQDDQYTHEHAFRLFAIWEAQDLLKLDELVELFDRASCQDPHDRIYGLIGLASDYKTSSDVFQPDYGIDLESLFYQVLSFCSPPNAVKLAGILLDSLGLRPFLNSMRKHAETICEDSSKYEHGVALLYIGILRAETEYKPERENSESLTLPKAFMVELFGDPYTSTQYMHFHERRMFLESKLYLSDMEAEPGDKIYWVSGTPHAFAYRKTSENHSFSSKQKVRYAPVGRGVITDKDDFESWSKYSSLKFSRPPWTQAEEDEALVYNVNRQDLLSLLQEERKLSQNQFDVQRKIASVDSLGVENVNFEPSPTFVSERILELNDLFRDMKTLAFIKKELA